MSKRMKLVVVVSIIVIAVVLSGCASGTGGPTFVSASRGWADTAGQRYVGYVNGDESLSPEQRETYLFQHRAYLSALEEAEKIEGVK